MSKSVSILVVYFTQTGQLERIVRSMLEPLMARSDVRIDWHAVDTTPAFRFPWRFLTFLDAFPESVYLDPPPASQPPIDAAGEYDLIVLAYQVWFLAPSQPIVAFLRSAEAEVLRGRRVMTVIGCRNMWTTAHTTMRGLLDRAGARLIDNVVLTDSGPFWSTFITTPWWMLTGRRKLPGLPAAGINGVDIARAARFGRALREALPAISRGDTGPFLGGLGAVNVARSTMLAERIGHRSFRIWGRIVRAAGRPGAATRKPILVVYCAFLIGAIVFLLPISMLVNGLLARFSRRVAAMAAVLEEPSGSSVARQHTYERG